MHIVAPSAIRCYNDDTTSRSGQTILNIFLGVDILENQILNQILSELKGLKIGQQTINERLDIMDARLDNMDARLDRLEENVAVIRADVSALRDQLLDLEAKNANNHMEMKAAIKDLSDRLSVLEVISGQNLRDIGMLKAIRS